MNVAGARSDFVKIAALVDAYAATDAIESILVHTGRYDDWAVNDVFLRDLAIPKPDLHLGVGSGRDAVQTAQTMTVFEEMVTGGWRSDAVLVVGEANQTIACGLVAAKLRIPVIHVEAGRRSRHRSLSEQINGVLTDALSDLLFCTEQVGVDNLAREAPAPTTRSSWSATSWPTCCSRTRNGPRIPRCSTGWAWLRGTMAYWRYIR